MGTWKVILAIVLILIAGIVFLYHKRYYHIYRLKDVYGNTVYVGWAKAKTINEKILPKAEQLGFRVYSNRSFCKIWGKDGPAEDYIKAMPEADRPYTTHYDDYFDDLH